jgi:hypothetical protein
MTIGQPLTSAQLRRRIDAWLATDDALDRRRELRADRIADELAWLDSPTGRAWRARIQRRLDRSREWLAPPTFNQLVRRHRELNEEQRLDSNEHAAAVCGALCSALAAIFG